MPDGERDRLVALDLIRGVAVLGILAVNVAGFAGPSASILSPHIPTPGSFADEAAYAAIFLIFEGKMRALFSLLFGASMAVFLERARQSAADGGLLQLRRLGWLMVFGLLHYFLFWWGDILFIYGVAGMIALAVRNLPARSLLAGALILFAAWHVAGAVKSLPRVMAEEAVRDGTATASQADDHARAHRAMMDDARSEMREYRSGYLAQIAAKLRERPFRPLEMTSNSMGETLPLILIGMALQYLGFFTGALHRSQLLRWGLVALTLGLAWTAAILAWTWSRQFPPQAMNAALLSWTAPAHLTMALGYAALLTAAAPRIAEKGVGTWLVRVGRMAFTNYIGTTVLMTALFYGWGAGLIGRFGQAELFGFVLLGWAAMLLASRIWLAHFRRGPLEWLWRSLTEGRLVSIHR